MAFPLAVPLILGGAKALYGLYQSNKANKALDELNKTPYPKYLTGQDIYGQADAMATGFTPQERAAAQGGLNRLATQRYRTASDRNPTLSGAIQAGTNYGSIQGTLGLAAQDAQLRRQNLQQLIGLIGGQANRQTGSDIDRRNAQEQAYGQAAQQGVENIFGAATDASNMLFSYGMNKEFGGLGGFGKQKTTPPTQRLPGMGNFLPLPYDEPYDYTPTKYNTDPFYG